MTSHSWHDPHIIRTKKYLLKALCITVGVFLGLFVLLHIAGALYISSIATKSSDAFHAGIERDLAYLKVQGDEMAQNELLIKYLLSGDRENLLKVIQSEKQARSIGLMGVANSQGIMMARTKSVGKVGDNTFLTSVVGRIVAEGKSAQSVEAPTGFDPNQLFLVTGRPIISEDHMIGGLYANYLTDDIYATRFKDTYLPSGVEVLFYKKGVGIYGDSFENVETRSTINSYFNSGSDWIQRGDSGKTISLQDGTFYLVENITFPGLEGSPGGVLLFIPRNDMSTIVQITIAALILIVFLFLTLRHHIRSRGEERGWRYYALLIFISIPVLMLVIIVLRLENTGYRELKKIPFTLYNSTIRLQPEFGIYDVNFEQRFSIVVDTGDEAINAVKIGLVFDPKAIKIKALETTNSSCSHVIENTINESSGTATLSCIVVKLNGEKGSLLVADVVVMPRRTGTFTLSFDKEETQVLASDGLGTDVLRMSQPGSYQVNTFDPNLFTSTSTTTTSSTSSLVPFIIFSPTHPNQSRWYNTESARFLWKGKPSAVYSYSFDDKADTVPSEKNTLHDTAIDVPLPRDGIFYFHLKLASGGSTTHYRIQVDKTPPSIVAMKLSADRVVVGDVVRFSFEAKDGGSGIQQNYYVNLGNHLFLPVGSDLFLPLLKVGEQKVVLRVYDDAGNFTEMTKVINVDKE